MRGLVLPGNMPYSAVTQPRPFADHPVGHFGFYAGRAKHDGVAGANEHAAGGVLGVAASDLNGAKLVGLAAVVACHEWNWKGDERGSI